MSEVRKPTTAEEYIASFSDEVQRALQEVRAVIRQEAPDAQETISYAIIAYKQNGAALVYLGGAKNHVSIYPAPTGVAALQDEMAAYLKGAGTLQFKLNEPLPHALIQRVVRHYLAALQAKAETKESAKAATAATAAKKKVNRA